MITMKDIAKKANVSIGTVDRVIHNRGRVSQSTSKKIQKIIKEYDYKPNIFASSLSAKSKIYIATIMPYLHQDNKYWELPHKGIKKKLNEIKNYNFENDFFFFDKYNPDSLKKIFNKIPISK